MKVRKVKAAEVSDVVELIDGFDRPRSPRPSTQELQAIYSLISLSGGCILGAFGDVNMVGTCTVNICPNLSWSGRPYAIIENVIVKEGYRNQGIGQALLQYAREVARKAGCYKVALMTGSRDPATHAFYESAGFSENKQGYEIRFSIEQ